MAKDNLGLSKDEGNEINRTGKLINDDVKMGNNISRLSKTNEEVSNNDETIINNKDLETSKDEYDRGVDNRVSKEVNDNNINNEIKNTEKIARENVLFDSQEPSGIDIKGYDFDEVENRGIDYSGLLDSYMSTGFQATHFAKAVEIINKMIKEKVVIYLGYTSNLVTSGLREVFKYLAKHKKVDVIVTTAGGIEEDFIKCFGSFKLGKFSASGELLRGKGVNRTGNILVPNSRYCKFEDFIIPILRDIYKEQKETGKIISVSELIKRLGKEINNEESIYYWCYKNNIDVYCPAITDGSLGDMIHFFQYENKDFKIDIASDIHKLNEFTITRKKTGIILLGSGIMKHHICNSNMMRNGADYSVYINSGEEWDGADCNARPDEAVSWGKIKKDSESVKVFGDATILFPLIVSKCFVG
jgi:deoxyhypusine synthase